MMKYNALKLRDSITEHIEYLLSNYQLTEEILKDLNRILTLEMSNSMIFQWWAENEKDIDKINSLIKEIESK